MKNIYKEKNDGELIKALAEKRESLRVIRFGRADNKIKNVKEGKSIRKDIARILTETRGRMKI